MTIDDIIVARGIEEVLHFTTNKGITGMIASGYVFSRRRLPDEKHLEHVYRYNCPDRSRDVDWHGYVNLSVTTVNRNLFGISKGKWHRADDGWWCIASFVPEVMLHDGVVFATTNNMYSGVLRQAGSSGLEQLFAPHIYLWSGNRVARLPSLPANQLCRNCGPCIGTGKYTLDVLARHSGHCSA